MKFSATEAGFKKGLGGASNSKSTEKYHYVLFGTQKDCQHPEFSGVYFEYDDQSKGAVNSVDTVAIVDRTVTFRLKNGEAIEVDCDVSAEQWKELLLGLATVFQLEHYK